MLIDNAHLVGKHDFGGKVIVGSDLCERIFLVPQRLIELLAGLVKELKHSLFADSGAQCQRVDEHAGSVADAQVGTSVADGGDTQLLVVGETRKCIEGGCECEMCRSDVVLTAEALYGFEVQLARQGLYDALLFGVGQV